MRKLVMWNLMSLDGYIEGPNRAIDWHEYYWGPELEALSKETGWQAGALLFGRVTYELMAGYWPTATGEIADYMNGLPKFVFSRRLKAAGWANTTLLSGDLVEETTRLKQAPGKDIFVFGSADLSANLIEAGLFDEYRIGLSPLLLGAGGPLFKSMSERRKLNLIEARPHSTGVVVLRYAPAR
jgi:dihydrofolate reductase